MTFTLDLPTIFMVLSVVIPLLIAALTVKNTYLAISSIPIQAALAAYWFTKVSLEQNDAPHIALAVLSTTLAATTLGLQLYRYEIGNSRYKD